MTNRGASTRLVLVALAGLLGAACSQTTRYRVLSFFFDGVPVPGAAAPGAAAPGGLSPEELRTRPNPYPPGGPQYIQHAPVRKRLCGACHDMMNNRLVQAPEAGLCLRCHGALVRRLAFVHGPVAANACLQCHHPHESTRRALLLDEPGALCRRCHDTEDLTTGQHHDAALARPGQSCLSCHDPHGGDGRMFLKRSEER